MALKHYMLDGRTVVAWFSAAEASEAVVWQGLMRAHAVPEVVIAAQVA
jgi:hypothetical protein